jgi:hypothetical protein
MAIKIVQDSNIPRISPPVGIASTSVPIALKSGYLRVTIGSTMGNAGGHVAIGTNPVATVNSYHITTYSIDILKETMKRQVISGITTGTTTTLHFAQNSGNPFVIGDYVTIENAPTVGLSTTHKEIIDGSDTSIVINFNSSSISNPDITGASVARSVKVSCLTFEPNTFFNIAEVVTLVSE